MLMSRLFGVATACDLPPRHLLRLQLHLVGAHFLATIMLIFEVPLMRISFFSFASFLSILAKMYFKTREAGGSDSAAAAY